MILIIITMVIIRCSTSERNHQCIRRDLHTHHQSHTGAERLHHVRAYCQGANRKDHTRRDRAIHQRSAQCSRQLYFHQARFRDDC